MAQQSNSVDGVFQMEAGIDPAPNFSSICNAQQQQEAILEQQLEDSDEDLTYNSQGKPVPRVKPGGDKK